MKNSNTAEDILTSVRAWLSPIMLSQVREYKTLMDKKAALISRKADIEVELLAVEKRIAHLGDIIPMHAVSTVPTTDPEVSLTTHTKPVANKSVVKARRRIVQVKSVKSKKPQQKDSMSADQTDAYILNLLTTTPGMRRIDIVRHVCAAGASTSGAYRSCNRLCNNKRIHTEIRYPETGDSYLAYFVTAASNA